MSKGVQEPAVCTHESMPENRMQGGLGFRPRRPENLLLQVIRAESYLRHASLTNCEIPPSGGSQQLSATLERVVSTKRRHPRERGHHNRLPRAPCTRETAARMAEQTGFSPPDSHRTSHKLSSSDAGTTPPDIQRVAADAAPAPLLHSRRKDELPNGQSDHRSSCLMSGQPILRVLIGNA